MSYLFNSDIAISVLIWSVTAFVLVRIVDIVIDWWIWWRGE